MNETDIFILQERQVPGQLILQKQFKTLYTFEFIAELMNKKKIWRAKIKPKYINSNFKLGYKFNQKTGFYIWFDGEMPNIDEPDDDLSDIDDEKKIQK